MTLQVGREGDALRAERALQLLGFLPLFSQKNTKSTNRTTNFFQKKNLNVSAHHHRSAAVLGLLLVNGSTRGVRQQAPGAPSDLPLSLLDCYIKLTDFNIQNEACFFLFVP